MNKKIIITLGIVVIGFVLFNNKNETLDRHSQNDSFGEVWKEHQKLP
tara:strand:- start:3012 stop:3152 length:141 start_codon:yes stop_codon:yes gene_type:complete